MLLAGRPSQVQGDVANPADVDRLFKGAVDTFGGISALVNCAIATGDLEVFDRLIATNLRGTFAVLWTELLTGFSRRTYHSFLKQCNRHGFPYLWSIYRLESWSRGTGSSTC